MRLSASLLPPKVSTRRRPAARLQLEQLEDRCLLNANPLNLIVTPPNAVEGQPTGPIQVATIQDSNPSAQAADLTATIDWGDHTPVATVSGTSGGIVKQADGSFAVTVAAGHTYAEEGDVGLTVAVSDTGGNANSVTATSIVADAALSPFSVRNIFAGSSPPAASGTFTVATFTDTNPLGTAADFTAVIHWGDGQTTTATAANGGIVSTGTSNLQPTFAVVAAHSYGVPTAGLKLSVQLSDVGGFNLQGNATLSASGNSGGGGGGGGSGGGGVGTGGGGGAVTSSGSGTSQPYQFVFNPSSINSLNDLFALLPGDLNSTFSEIWMLAQMCQLGGPLAKQFGSLQDFSITLEKLLLFLDPTDFAAMGKDAGIVLNGLLNDNRPVTAQDNQANGGGPITDQTVTDAANRLLANPLYQSPIGKLLFVYITGVEFGYEEHFILVGVAADPLETNAAANTIGIRTNDFGPWTQLQLEKLSIAKASNL